jgi:hypothetical protein
MKLYKFETSQLTGHALDWAVAKCEGIDYGKDDVRFRGAYARKYSTDWAQAGSIIERENIGLVCQQIGSTQRCAYRHTENGEVFYYYGPTPLIAAMRCYVALKLGDEVELPEELT